MFLGRYNDVVGVLNVPVAMHVIIALRFFRTPHPPGRVSRRASSEATGALRSNSIITHNRTKKHTPRRNPLI